MPQQHESGPARGAELHGLTHPSDGEAALSASAPAAASPLVPEPAAFSEETLPEPVQHGPKPDELPDVPPAVISASVAALTKAFSPQQGSQPPAALQDEAPGPSETVIPPLLEPSRPMVAMPAEAQHSAAPQPFERRGVLRR